MDQSKIYGDALSLGSSAFSKTVGTYANSELATSVSLTSTNSYDSSTTQSVGSYEDEISISSATGTGEFVESNYDISYTSADLIINKRPIELTAGDQTKIYGDFESWKF